MAMPGTPRIPLAHGISKPPVRKSASNALKRQQRSRIRPLPLRIRVQTRRFPPLKKRQDRAKETFQRDIYCPRDARPEVAPLQPQHGPCPVPCGVSSKRNSSGNHGLGSSLPVWRSGGVYFPSLIILSRCSRMVRSRLAWQGHRRVSGIPQGVPKAGPGSPIDVEPTLTLP